VQRLTPRPRSEALGRTMGRRRQGAGECERRTPRRRSAKVDAETKVGSTCTHNGKLTPRSGEAGTTCTNNGKTTPRSGGVRESDAKEQKCKG
jgi:hypothetical protein